MSKLGLFSTKYSEYGNKFLKDISLLHFNYENNKNSKQVIFEEYKIKLDSENEESVILRNLLKKYENNFIKNWKIFFENEALNYSCINKIQRKNNYVENYKKRLRDILYKKNNIYIIFIIYNTIYKQKRFKYFTIAFIFIYIIK